MYMDSNDVMANVQLLIFLRRGSLNFVRSNFNLDTLLRKKIRNNDSLYIS